MRAFQVRRYGPPEALEPCDLQDPVPGPGDVVVRVRAIGLNFADCMARAGVYPRVPKPPFVPGMEVAGDVVAVGEGVAEPRPGARVMAVPIFGGHAEKVCLPAMFTQALPGAIGYEEGAAIAVTGLTADHALFTLGRLRLGERVAITAAAGGVGTMAVQMAAGVGARVLAVASTEEKRRLAARLGAQETVGYEEYRAALGEGVDLVVDAVSGALFRPGWRALRPNGRYVLYGFAAAAGARRIRRLKAALDILRMGAVVPFGMVSSCRALLAFNLSLLPQLASQLKERLAALLGLITVGEIKPVIGEVLPFHELPRAHALLQGRQSSGKLVVSVP